MNRSRTSQVIRLVSALAVPALVGALLLPGVASAKTPKGAVKGACTSLTGNAMSTVFVGGCNTPGNTGGVFNFTAGAASGSSSIAWNNGSVSTFNFGGKQESPTVVKKGVTVANKKFKCPSGDIIEFLLKGKVTADTDVAPFPGIKGSVKASVCVDSSSNVSLLAGTVMSL